MTRLPTHVHVSNEHYVARARRLRREGVKGLRANGVMSDGHYIARPREWACQGHLHIM